jgi:hypothetical protein
MDLYAPAGEPLVLVAVDAGEQSCVADAVADPDGCCPPAAD